MLDDLLGRTELKERIAELEDEIESLESRLEAEERRRRDAVTEKQEADRRVNELESKVEELQDRLERAGDDSGRDIDFRLARSLRGAELDAVLGILRSIEGPEESLTTVRASPDDSVPGEFGKETTALLRRIDSTTGVVCYGDDPGAVRVALTPTVAVGETRVDHSSRFDVDPSLFSLPETHAVAVVRSDEYAGGVYSDGERVGFSSLSPDVKSKHSKGGFSQGRFERARDEEVKRHVRDAAESFDETVADHGADPDHVFVAGEPRVARDFADEIDTDADVSTRTTDARGSGEELLRRGYETVESVRMYVV